MYFLLLLFLAFSHKSVYLNVWNATVHKIPWFIERELAESKQESPRLISPKRPAESWENPAFRAKNDEDRNGIREEIREVDVADMPLAPPPAPWTRGRPVYPFGNALASSSRSLPRTPPDPVQKRTSSRPAWARRITSRRGIDPPFTVRTTSDVRPPVPTPKTSAGPSVPRISIPEPEGLNGGFLDLPSPDEMRRRISYGRFPTNAVDPNRSLAGSSPLSEWVRADEALPGIYIKHISPA